MCEHETLSYATEQIAGSEKYIIECVNCGIMIHTYSNRFIDEEGKKDFFRSLFKQLKLGGVYPSDGISIDGDSLIKEM